MKEDHLTRKRQLTAEKNGYTPIKPGLTSKIRITRQVKPLFITTL
jgi:hypothetical protein